MKAGIYQIQSNIHPERIYIGSSANIKHRIVAHLHDLRNNKHGNAKLQNHYNKYGEDDLLFEVVQHCDKKDLFTVEDFYITIYKPWFNISPVAGSCLGVKHTEDAKRNMSEAHIGLRHTEETKQKMSASHIGVNDWSRGNKHATANKDRIHTPEHNKRVSEAITLWWAKRKANDKY